MSLISSSSNVAAGNDGPFSKNYQLVTCGNDHNAKLWEVSVVQDKCEDRPTTASITLVRVLERHSNAITCVKFSANGLYIASSGLDKTTVIWETVRSVKATKTYIEA